MSAYTKKWSNAWLANGSSSVTATPLVTVVSSVCSLVLPGAFYAVMLEMSDGNIEVLESWREVPEYQLKHITLSTAKSLIESRNLDAWRERHMRRRNPSGCYGKDKLDQLVGL